MRKPVEKLCLFPAALLLSVSLLVPGLVRPAAAASAQLTVRAAFDAAQYTAGETATVRISLSAAAEAVEVGGFSFRLSAPEGMTLQELRMDPDGVYSECPSPLGIAEASAETRRAAFSQVGTRSLQVDAEEIVIAEASYLVTQETDGKAAVAFEELALAAQDGSALSVLSEGGEAAIMRPASADDPVCTVLIDGKTEKLCKAGDTVTVTMALCGTAESVSFCSMEDTVCFDPSCFTLVEGSVAASVGSAVAKTTGGVADRVRFSVYGTEKRTVRAGETLLTFRLTVQKSGVLTHKGTALTDENAAALPFSVQTAAAEVYAQTDEAPVCWSDESELRNFSDEALSLTVWIGLYRADGRMESVVTYAQTTLAGGETLPISFDESLIPDGGCAKILAVEDTSAPLVSCKCIDG